jgi:hypothetical protein
MTVREAFDQLTATTVMSTSMAITRMVTSYRRCCRAIRRPRPSHE